MRNVMVLCVVSLLLAPTVLADAKVTQKTQVQFGGVVGGVMNVFGGKATKEGVTSEVAVKGDRRVSRSGSNGEIVDLGEEKVYTIDYDRKTYRVQTFAEIRKQFEESQKESAEESESSSSSEKDPNAKEYEVDFDLRETGKKETINGFNAREVVATVTIREKGKKLEEAGGSVLTSNMWLAPRIAAMREVENFEKKYLDQLWGTSGVDLRSLSAILSASPTFGKAMKKLQEKKVHMDGTAVRTTMKFETVADPRVRQEESANPSAAAARMVGGLMKRMKRDKPQESQASSSKADEKPAAGRNLLFNSNFEVLTAASKATAEDVAVPADFKLKK
jgi:hypothetical protein